MSGLRKTKLDDTICTSAVDVVDERFAKVIIGCLGPLPETKKEMCVCVCVNNYVLHKLSRGYPSAFNFKILSLHYLSSLYSLGYREWYNLAMTLNLFVMCLSR